jgi:hypothetical protein
MRNFDNIDDVLVDQNIAKTHFTCNLEVCKGACCTMQSEYGAPLKEKEIQIIEKILPIVKTYLTERNINEIETNGFWEEKDDELMTTSINNRDCVFVFYEDDIAKCAIEKAYYDKKVDFIKPISCHLFPIRINNFGGDVLKYEQYTDCESALEKGKETKISILEFCKTAIIRAYNQSFFNKVKNLNGK